MRRVLPWLLALPLLAFASDQRTPDAPESAKSFLASLDRDLHRKAVLPFDGDYRTLWRYTPVSRQGVSYGDLSSDQTEKANSLLRAALSALGYERTQTVRAIEHELSIIENNARRDRNAYFLTFFGVPHDTQPWGWRYEGHHVSLNFTYQGNKLVSSSPQFFGSNPAEIRSGDKKGTRMLAIEEDLGIAFLATLTNDQRAKAIVSDRAPSEIYTSEDRTAKRQEGGIGFSSLNAGQQARLRELVMANCAAQAPTEAKRRAEAIEKAGWDKLTFAWMGAPDRSGAHYYRIQGPTFIVEFDNFQNGANHIHLVWRDFDGDFGRDVLKDHYEHSGPDHGHLDTMSP